jgi:hypothetical protein
VDAVGYYGRQAKDMAGQVVDVLGRAKDAFTNAFRNTGS